MENCKFCTQMEERLLKLIDDKFKELEDTVSVNILDAVECNLDSINWDRKIRRVLIDSLNDFEE